MTEAELQNEVSLLEWQVAKMAVDNRTLASENRRLRKMTTNGKQGKLLHRTAADARQIVAWRFAGYSVSRRNCLSYGMPERRWAWAIALLKLGGVLDMAVDIADSFLLEDAVDAGVAIDKAVRRCELNGLGPLVFRLPRGRAVTPKR